MAEFICTRDACRYVGEVTMPEQKSRNRRMLEAAGVTVLIHAGIALPALFFPLIFLIYPFSMLVVFLAGMNKEKPECPACEKRDLVPVDSERGRALQRARAST